jgi:hypothetical protein
VLREMREVGKRKGFVMKELPETIQVSLVKKSNTETDHSRCTKCGFLEDWTSTYTTPDLKSHCKTCK